MYVVSGLITGPKIVRYPLILSMASLSLVNAMPANKSECPPINFVALYKTTSAPCKKGAWNTGPMNVLSTKIRQFGFFSLARRAASAISVMLKVGLAGLSMYTASKRGAVIRQNEKRTFRFQKKSYQYAKDTLFFCEKRKKNCECKCKRFGRFVPFSIDS